MTVNGVGLLVGEELAARRAIGRQRVLTIEVRHTRRDILREVFYSEIGEYWQQQCDVRGALVACAVCAVITAM